MPILSADAPPKSNTRRPIVYTPGMIKAIVFDFDGVLVDSEPLHYRAFLRLLEPMGMGFEYRDYLADYAGFDDRDLLRTVYHQHDKPLDDTELKTLIDRKADAFEQIVSEGIAPLPGAADFVRHASARLPIAIASGALARDIDLILPAIGADLPERFETMVTADQVTRSKPDPETYRLAAQRLGIEPAHCLAIEDTDPGLVAAVTAGMRTIGLPNTYPAEALGHAERVIDSLEGLTVEQIQSWFG